VQARTHCYRATLKPGRPAVHNTPMMHPILSPNLRGWPGSRSSIDTALQTKTPLQPRLAYGRQVEPWWHCILNSRARLIRSSDADLEEDFLYIGRDVDKGFPKRMRKARRLRNLTIRQLGKFAGVSGASICRYENGLTVPRLLTMKRLAIALGTTVAFLMEGDEDGVDPTLAMPSGNSEFDSVVTLSRRIIAEAGQIPLEAVTVQLSAAPAGWRTDTTFSGVVISQSLR